MKFSSCISIVGLIAGVASATNFQRDLATIQNVLNTISTQITSLDNVLKSWNGGDTGPLTSASSQLLSTLNSGIQTISGTSPLTETEALGVASYVQGLTTGITSVVNDFISKHDALVAAGAGPTVLQALQDQKTASQGLSQAITSKVPQDLQAIASQLSGSIADTVQKGIDAFQGAGAAPGSSGAAPSGPSATGTSGGSSPTSAPPSVPSISAPGGPVPSSGSSPSGTTVSSGSQSSAPAIPNGSEPSTPVVSSGSEPGLTSVAGGSSPSSTSASTPVPFTGAATKANAFGGSGLLLLAAAIGYFA